MTINKPEINVTRMASTESNPSNALSTPKPPSNPLTPPLRAAKDMNRDQLNQYLPNILNSLYVAVGGEAEDIKLVCDESALQTYIDCVRIATKFDGPPPTSEQVGNIWKTLFRQEKNYLHNTKESLTTT